MTVKSRPLNEIEYYNIVTAFTTEGSDMCWRCSVLCISTFTFITLFISDISTDSLCMAIVSGDKYFSGQNTKMRKRYLEGKSPGFCLGPGRLDHFLLVLGM